MKTTIKNFYLAVVVIALAATARPVQSMPAVDHNRGAVHLQDTPVNEGGLGGMTEEQFDAIREWMDWPSTQTGDFINHVTETAVHPNNHGHLRHNPENVGRVFSGDGTIDPAARNLARLHKIQDVAHNTAGIDGYSEITTQMRNEAQTICEYIKQNKALPNQLPRWVDSPGPLRSPSVGELAEAIGPKSMTSESVELLASSGRVVAKAGGALGSGLAIADGAVDIYHGVRTDNHEQIGVGSAKVLGGSMMAGGTATVQPEVVVAGAAVYTGAVVYDNRDAIAQTANDGVVFTKENTKAGFVTAEIFAINHTSDETQDMVLDHTPKCVKKLYFTFSDWAHY